jgi:hypothetical protein
METGDDIETGEQEEAKTWGGGGVLRTDRWLHEWTKG